MKREWMMLMLLTTNEGDRAEVISRCRHVTVWSVYLCLCVIQCLCDVLMMFSARRVRRWCDDADDQHWRRKLQQRSMEQTTGSSASQWCKSDRTRDIDRFVTTLTLIIVYSCQRLMSSVKCICWMLMMSLWRVITWRQWRTYSQGIFGRRVGP